MSSWDYFKNFQRSEFKCPCGCNNNPDINVSLMYILQFVRNKYKKPVVVTSGYRCQTYNDKLEGSIKNSDHIKGKAADFYISGLTNTLDKRKQIMELIRCMPNFKYAYCNGLIIYADGTSKAYTAAWMGSSIHVSVN